MKHCIALLFTFFCINAVAEDIYYTLSTEKICSIEVNDENANCWGPDKWSETMWVFMEGNTWCLKDEIGGTCPVSRVVDKSNGILILQENKKFAGSSMLYLIEKNKSFIWTEVTYNATTNESDSSIRYGTYE